MFYLNTAQRHARLIVSLFVISCFSVSSACVSNPSVEFERQAGAYQLQKSILRGSVFDLVVFEKQRVDGEALHVYIGGDGQPWLNNIYKSKDPTSRRMTALALMQLDHNPAIYLGRPCYHTQGVGRNCEDKWWTSHRYSIQIVDDMRDVLNQYIAERGIHSVTLIGFSGGGTLAMLLAPLIKEIVKVVTVSGNLDTEAWLALHRYTPLLGSINPARQMQSVAGIDKLHLLGMQDHNLPIKTLIDRFEPQPNTQIIRYPEFNHQCCWQSVWPALLDQI